ncbi:winged helix DNA-binding domain-containing protein [Nocardioides sp.]|uniref:winged helix DNA-binding domain-containing protein n=1 Tax=Nocardioides sp. TaxID=35761 RepID=UPI00272044B1|nr:winged helix DNA-binding domain-containing protein [Nocardioides sp.]MDO9458104.1 winged helix DNA-binding domain-containing protein [Nocardioides sp.]
MRLTAQRLNRTLLRRQHLLERVSTTVVDECRHLVGLQAQENLPPYLSLAARLESFDPHEVTRGLEDRALVRFLTMRGTVHLLAADDVGLRSWTTPVHEREIKVSQNVGTAREVDRVAYVAALAEVLADGPLPQKTIGLALAEHFPGHTAAQLGQLARSAAPLVQLPPRGTWKGSGGVVYDLADRWTGHPLDPPDPADVVRRYLRAYGPASAADVTTWSGVTRLGPVVKAMDDLVVHEDHEGRPLVDVADGEIEEEDAPAPVRLLGTYDNVWLSHAARDRVTRPGGREAWSGPNGASASTVFADGWLVGLWRAVDGRVELGETLRALTRRERSELAVEVSRVESLLAT